MVTEHSSEPSEQRRVVLYASAGWHLCESARRVLESVRQDTPFRFEEIAIDGDAALETTYRERIPVVTIDGEDAFTYFVHPDALRRRLAQRAR